MLLGSYQSPPTNPLTPPLPGKARAAFGTVAIHTYGFLSWAPSSFHLRAECWAVNGCKMQPPPKRYDRIQTLHSFSEGPWRSEPSHPPWKSSSQQTFIGFSSFLVSLPHLLTVLPGINSKKTTCSKILVSTSGKPQTREWVKPTWPGVLSYTETSGEILGRTSIPQRMSVIGTETSLPLTARHHT